MAASPLYVKILKTHKMNRSVNYFILILIVLSFSLKSSTLNSPTQNEDVWKQVDTYLEQQLPESAKKELGKLELIAEKISDIQERIKIKLYELKIDISKNPDSAPLKLIGFEIFTETLKLSPEKQLAYSISAELYFDYYKTKKYNIDRRTDIANDNLPADISTWTKKHYETKIKYLLDKSWENQEITQAVSLSSFEKLLNRNDNENYDTPTVFDYLAKKRIQFFQYFEDKENETKTHISLIDFRKKQQDTTLTVLAELALIGSKSETDNYIETLDSLENLYKPSASIVEILNNKAKYYLQHSEIDKNKKKAYEICTNGIKQFPEYPRIGLLKNIIADIEEKTIKFGSKNQVKPFSKLTLELETENINELTLEVYRLKTTAEEFVVGELNQRINPNKSPFDKELIETITIPVSQNSDFESTKTIYNLNTKGYGIYECVAYPSGVKDQNLKFRFTTTDFSIIKRAVSEKEIAYYVVDRITGKRIKNVGISLYEYKWAKDKYNLNLVAKGTSNSKGYVQLKSNKTYGEDIIILRHKGDSCFISYSYIPFYNTNQDTDNKQDRIDIFTDRTIYRPRQIVYFKAISYALSAEKQEVTVGQNINFELVDANGSIVGTKSLKTNDFGSASGEFILPADGLNGYYSIRANSRHTTNFRVEEYKRPTFEITLDKPKEEISFGQNINITGEAKSYAGYTLSDASVKYKIIRYVHPFWRWFIPANTEKIIKSGETKTDSKGVFSIDFIPAKDKNISAKGTKQIYNYKIEVDVTDAKGESQHQQLYIPVGEQSMFIFAEIPQIINKKEIKNIKVSTKTITGEKLNKELSYKIFKVIDTDEYIETIDSDKSIKELKEIYKSTHNTESENFNIDLNKYQSGRYKIEFSTLDKDGQEIKTEHFFVLFDNKDKKPPVKTHIWSLESDIECVPGEKALIKFGTSVKGANVLMEVMYGDKVIASKWLNFSNTIKSFKVPFPEKFKSGITINFTFVRDEKLLQKTIRIKEKKQSKTLTPKLTVFRDKLLPGEDVQWTINIPELNAINTTAEVLAGMYDASLDALQAHNWSFNPVYQSYFPAANQWMSHFKPIQYNYLNYQQDKIQVPYYVTPSINKPDLFAYEVVIVGYGRMKKSQITGAVNLAAPAVSESTSEANLLLDDVVRDAIDIEIDNTSTTPQIQKIRTNFNETAFFYPHLKSDSLGNVQLNFTMPESLTRWKLNVLAHTKDLYFGQTATEVITQQDLMVQLNLPRFVRQSDIVELKANVVNLSDTKLNTSVRLNTIDPRTEAIILLNDTNAINIEIEAGETKTLTWKVQDFGHRDLLICKVVAQSDNFSDGEQEYLPVLSDQVLVTESYPFTIKGTELSELKFDKITENIDKVETKLLNLDFTANPFWNAIKAMPVLTTPENENAIDYYIALYVNTLASKIVTDNPYIKETIKQMSLSGDADFQSPLYQKQDLKNVSIENTPWLANANNETERQLRLALLLDYNQLKMQEKTMFEKLQKLQLSNGAFEWFAGMGQSRWVTQFIVDGLVKVKQITGDSKFNDMINQALEYLDEQINKDYLYLKAQVKEYDKKMTINSMQLHYLSIRTQLQKVVPYNDNNEAIQYFINQTEKYHTRLGLYERALAALTLYYSDKSNIYLDIIKSLKENAIKSDEMGMYWAKNKAGYFWNERPIAAHTKLMEAMSLNKNNNADIENMKVWLLRQKQTQAWDSPISSVNAIYALTNLGNSTTGKMSQYIITTDTKAVNSLQGKSGTGNVTLELTTDEVKKSIKVHPDESASNTSRAWGTLYWQYYQNLNDVQSSGKELKVSKQMYVEKIIDNKKTLYQINDVKDKTATQIVNIGDKVIVRMIVSTDRNLEFVALKDDRASNLEPVKQLSGCNWKENVIYYRTAKDRSTQYFFTFLPQGTYVFEDEYYVNNSGEFSGGTASIQCLYAPEFIGTSSGEKIYVK